MLVVKVKEGLQVEVQVGAWLMHFFMVQVDYRLRYMVDTWFRLLVQVVWCKFIGTGLQQYISQWFHHSTYTSGWLDGARTSGCSHLPVVAGEHRGL
jgi:hypothetical protein